MSLAQLAVALPGVAVAGPILVAVGLVAVRRTVDRLDRRRQPAPADPDPDTPLPYYPPLPLPDGTPSRCTALVPVTTVEQIAALLAPPSADWWLTGWIPPVSMLAPAAIADEVESVHPVALDWRPATASQAWAIAGHRLAELGDTQQIARVPA
nr:hypothetical protein [Micromonospora sp. DSM 115978]